jgi:glycosyltransferase involved in cell wall biosynthesis
MRIAFLDTSGLSYDAATPYEQPLGGTQSAVCYLAAELAKQGHDVAVLNGVREARRAAAVWFFPLKGFTAADPFDMVIIVNAAIGDRMRRQVFGTAQPMVLWCHHAFDQPAIQALAKPEEQAAWDAVAFVSASQRQPYLDVFGLDQAKTVVMHNGVSPAFEAPISPLKEPPVLFYTSTPFRGLDVLLVAFPAIRQATGATLRIFSSMDVYGMPNTDFEGLYALARGMNGVEYVGSIGQRQLAQELAGSTALAHPSTFPECHSIAAIEAMAVGAAVFTTDLGGQRETTGGLASMIPAHGDKPRLAREFADMAIATLQAMQADPDLAATERNQRVAYVRQHYLWKDRAKDWSDWLEQIAKGNRGRD